MNLASIIELWGGGPGSGCNPEVADPKCGRPAGSGANTGVSSKEVQDYVQSYRPIFQKAAQQFKLAVGDFGLVEGRLKSPESVAEKMARRGTTDVTKVEDVAGLRVTVDSMQAMTEAVARVKAGMNVTWEDDKVNNPTGGVYRAYHLTITQDGKPVEVQVRTMNQSKVAIWMHDTIYKGALKNSQIAIDYAKKVSEYMHNLDMGGRIGSMPPCPAGIPCFREDLPFVEHLV